jgi:TolB-like protein/Tfp pilus assembly protein PilF
MSDDVQRYSAFISHSTADQAAAFEVCDRLEEAGLTCWIAPRDIRAGQDFGAEIIRGIEGSDALVLLLSQNSNLSRTVKSEIERAYMKGKPIFSVRIEDVMPAAQVELFLSSSQWIDAFQGRIDEHFDTLISEVSSLSGEEPAVTDAGPKRRIKHSKLGKSRTHPALYAVGAIAALIIGVFAWQSYGPSVGSVPENSIAVLPFANMSGDPDQEYFSDGIAEELLNILAQVRDLKVPARTSTFKFKGQNVDVAEIALQLNVAYVLEGSVRKAGDTVRINAQLIDADTGYQLWSETYDRQLDDIFAIQDEISGSIVKALREVLDIDEAQPLPVARAAESKEAYDEYLLGQHLMHQRTKASIEQATMHFQSALELDADYAPAHAASAIAWMLLQDSARTYGDLPLEEAVGKAMPAAQSALELDPDLAEAHASMGFIHFQQQSFEETLEYWNRAVELNPNYALVYSWRSIILGDIGRYQEALESIRAAAELDPLSVNVLNNYAMSLFGRGQYDENDRVMLRIKAIAPPFYNYTRSWQLWQRGMPSEAIFALLDGLEADPDDQRIPGGLANMFGLLGFHQESLRHASESNRYLPYQWISDWQTVLDIRKEEYARNPDDRRAMANLGQALLASGDAEAATPHLERYVQGFEDRIGPSTEAAGYVALIRKANGDEKGAGKILDAFKARHERALTGGLDNNSIRILEAMISLIEGRQEDALTALDGLSRGMGIEPQVVASLRLLTPVNDDAQFDEILATQENHFADERQRLMTRICGNDGRESWQPLPETCAGQHPVD